jgi:pimeloyl-ACP methyl ester carboxylesterase
MTWIILPVFDVAPDGTAYELTGPNNAPCVVLIHGLGLSMSLWDAHMPAFKDWRILRYDLFGHGQTAPATSVGSLTLYSDQIAELMDHLGIKAAHIVGFSIGGMINRRFALDHANKVLSLAILNSPHDRGENAQRQVEDRARAARDQGAFATFDAALERWFTPEYLRSGQGPKLVRDWRALVDDESYAQTAWVLANGVRELIAPEPAVLAPTLVMTCENDSGSTPKMSQDIGSEVDGAQVIIVPRLRHLGLMEDPDAFTDPVVRFLSRRD